MNLSPKLIAILLLSASLYGCGAAKEEPPPPTAPAVQTIAENKGQEAVAALQGVKQLLTKTSDATLPATERESVQAQAIEGLSNVLALNESFLLHDQAVAESLDHLVKIKSKTASLNGNEATIRWIRYDGSPEINGNLERVWSFIQWGKEASVHSQLLIEQGAELVDDYFVTTIQGKEHLVALGHLTEQTNSTVFAAAWQLKQDKWEPANVFPEQVTMPEGWQAEVFENQVTITNRENANVSITAAKDGFTVSMEESPHEEIHFKVDGDHFVNERPQSSVVTSQAERFDPRSIKVGDRIAGMEVTKVEIRPSTDAQFYVDQAHIDLRGEVEVKGTMEYVPQGFEHVDQQVQLTVDSNAIFPRMKMILRF